MASEEQKKARTIKAFNIIIHGLVKGLHDMLGPATAAVIGPIGEKILEDMEKDLGLEIQGETPQNILTEIERILIDEYGIVSEANIEIHPDTHEVDIITKNSVLWQATTKLVEDNLPPLSCISMMVAEAALRKRLGRKAKFVGITFDHDSRTMDIDFHMYDED